MSLLRTASTNRAIALALARETSLPVGKTEFASNKDEEKAAADQRGSAMVD